MDSWTDLSFMNRPLEVKEELPSRRQAVELQRDRLESTLYVKVQSVDGKRKLWFSWKKKTSHTVADFDELRQKILS